MKKIIYFILPIVIISCLAVSEISEVKHKDAVSVFEDAGTASNDDAGCPNFTPINCTRCADVLMDVTKAATLCQNYDGIPGGIPSEWVYESFVTCSCNGACASVCNDACDTNQNTQFTIDQNKMSLSCMQCLQSIATSPLDTPGCGELLQLCNSDLTL